MSIMSFISLKCKFCCNLCNKSVTSICTLHCLCAGWVKCFVSVYSLHSWGINNMILTSCFAILMQLNYISIFRVHVHNNVRHDGNNFFLTWLRFLLLHKSKLSSIYQSNTFQHWQFYENWLNDIHYNCVY